MGPDYSYPLMYREGMESLMQHHAYTRSPGLRSYTESDLEETLKQHREFLSKGKPTYISVSESKPTNLLSKPLRWTGCNHSVHSCRVSACLTDTR